MIEVPLRPRVAVRSARTLFLDDVVDHPSRAAAKFSISSNVPGVCAAMNCGSKLKVVYDLWCARLTGGMSLGESPGRKKG